MKKHVCKLGTGFGFALLSNLALAAQEDTLDTIWRIGVYVFLLFVAAVIFGVYFMRSRDKRRAPLDRIFEDRRAIQIHSVGPDTPVIECVRTMAGKKIGALIILEGGKLVGIFTERDALNKVLAAGLDPITTKISAVMTRDPYCVPPTTTIGDAMEMVTQRRFRHLPVVEDGKVIAVISSGDLTHWLVKDQMVSDVQELVELAARS